MKPVYEHGGITLYEGRAEDVVPCVVADVLVTDPPYGVGLGHTAGSGGGHGLQIEGYASFEDTYENFVRHVVPTLNQVLDRVKRAAVFTGPHIHEQRKPDAIGGVLCSAAAGRHCWGFKNFLPVLFYGTAPNLSEGARVPTAIASNAIVDRVSNSHPVPKPLEWMLWLVNLASESVDTIIDPFAGSGTTLVAAKQLGRRAIGIEIEPKYIEIAIRRLEQEVLPMFESQAVPATTPDMFAPGALGGEGER